MKLMDRVTSRKLIGALIAAVALSAVSAAWSQTDAWMMTCDWCDQESEFRQRALAGPGAYSPVYVSNFSTNETRKYQRFFFTEDFDGALVRTVEVVPADFSQAEKVIFSDVIKRTMIAELEFDRRELSIELPVMPDADSLVEDIRSGAISTGFIQGIRSLVKARDLVPDLESINRAAGFNNSILGLNQAEGRTFRLEPLQLVFEYPDGSKLFVTLFADGSLGEWVGFDAVGSEVAFDAPAANSTVPVAPIEGNYVFGTGTSPNVQRAIQDLIRELNRPPRDGGGLVCEASIVPGRLVCTLRTK